MSADLDAAALIQEHGRRAPQLLVDQLVQAVKAGDEERIATLDKLMRAVDTLLKRVDHHPTAAASGASLNDYRAKCASG